MNGATVRTKSGAFAGEIRDHIFHKSMLGSKHLLRQPIAWAIDADIFDRVIAPLCYSIHVTDRETGKVYIVGVETFRKNCGKLNRGYGQQYYLELVHWKIQ